MFRRLAIAVLLSGCADRMGTPGTPVQVDVKAVQGAPVVAGVRAEPARRRAGDEVEVEWRGDFWPARILEVKGDRYLVRYDGYTKEWDETVGEDRVRDRRATPEPAEDDSDPPEEPDENGIDP